MTFCIGILKYTNASPFYANLFKYLTSRSIEHEVIAADPVTMYEMFQEGKVDVALISSVAVPALRNQGYKIFNAGITSIGPVKSVLLVTKFPLNKKAPCKIAVTAESNTSVTLLRILLDNKEAVFWRSRNPIDDLNSKADGALLIGDTALEFFYRAKHAGIINRFHIVDLGDLWHKFSSLPMVWGCWCLKNGMKKYTEETIEEILLQSSNFPNDFLEHHAYDCIDSGIYRFSPEELLSYWRQFKYKIDDFSKQGLEKFLDLSIPYIDGSLIKLH